MLRQRYISAEGLADLSLAQQRNCPSFWRTAKHSFTMTVVASSDSSIHRPVSRSRFVSVSRRVLRISSVRRPRCAAVSLGQGKTRVKKRAVDVGAQAAQFLFLTSTREPYPLQRTLLLGQNGLQRRFCKVRLRHRSRLRGSSPGLFARALPAQMRCTPLGGPWNRSPAVSALISVAF